MNRAQTSAGRHDFTLFLSKHVKSRRTTSAESTRTNGHYPLLSLVAAIYTVVWRGSASQKQYVARPNETSQKNNTSTKQVGFAPPACTVRHLSFLPFASAQARLLLFLILLIALPQDLLPCGAAVCRHRMRMVSPRKKEEEEEEAAEEEEEE